MSLLVRLIFFLAGALAAALLARSAPNFPIVQGMIGLWLIAALVGVLALRRR